MTDKEDPNKEKNKENSLPTESAKAVLEGLTPREANVLRMRFGIDMNSGHTLEEIGKQFNITRDRIREIEEKAHSKLRHCDQSNQLICSFCGRSKDEVDRLIASHISASCICEECIKVSVKLLDE